MDASVRNNTTLARLGRIEDGYFVLEMVVT